MATYGEILTLKELCEALTHTITVTSLNEDRTVVSTCNTLYLHTGSFFYIDEVKYTVTGFTINSSITLDTALPEDTESFTIPTPTFYHGTPKAVTQENTEDQNEVGYQGPIIWLLEWVDIVGPDDELSSAIRSAITGASWFFLDDCKSADWSPTDHHTEIIEPMQNEFNFVLQNVIKKRLDIFGDLHLAGQRRVRPHSDFGRYVNDKGYEGTLLVDHLSGIQVVMDIPFVIDLDCCSQEPSTTCPVVTVYINGVLMDTLDAGTIQEYSVLDQDDNEAGSKTSNTIWGVTVGGEPVTVQFQGVDTGVNVDAGGTVDFRVHDDADSDVGTLTTNTDSVKEVEVSDSNVSNSDDSYSQDVKPEQDLELPDITVTDSDGSSYSHPAVQNVTCTPAVDPLQRQIVWKPGQTTSYFTGDGADTDRGIGVDFFTLSENNVFGNTNAFTDTLGTQVYTNDVILDHRTYNQDAGTIQGWYRIHQTPGVNLAVIMTSTYTFAGYSDWGVPQIGELFTLHNAQAHIDTGYPFNYSPLNVTSNFCWTNEIGGVANAYYYVATNGTTNRTTYTNTGIGVIFRRTYTLAELGL